MATTAKPIDILAVGLRDTAGVVLASANCRFYNPGTLVAGVVYSDAACISAYAQPVVANAGGQATVYALEPVRMIAKNAADTVTYYDGIVNLQRHDSVYVTAAGINGGVETTLETVLGGLGSSFGDGFNYKESAAATSRSFISVIRNIAIQAADYGVVADGSTDDTTALAAGIARVKALGGGRLLLPSATIKITSAITIDTAGVSIEGQGRGISIIKNYSTSGNALNVTLSSGDCKLFLKGFSITAATTSSGTGINVSVGNNIVIEDVGVGLHRTGIDTSVVSGADLRHVFIDSTDADAAGIGINLGSSSVLHHSHATASSTAGIGIKATGTDTRIIAPYTTNFATGISVAGIRCSIRDPNVATATTGISLTVANGLIDGAILTSNTTGISVGAVAGSIIKNSIGSGNTTDLSIDASATKLIQIGNTFPVVTDASTSNFVPLRCRQVITTSSSTTPTFTPDFSDGHNIQVIYCTNASGTITLTIANATNTSLLTKGDIVLISIVKGSGAFNLNASSWGTQYLTVAGGAPSSYVTTQNAVSSFWMTWDGTNFRMVTLSKDVAW